MDTTESNMATDVNSRRGGQKYGFIPKEAWTGLIGLLAAIIPSAIAGYVAIQVANTQLATQKQRIDENTTKSEQNTGKIEELIEKSNEFTRLLAVEGTITMPITRTIFPEDRILCSGRISNLQRGFHLWIAVEADNGIYYKGPEVVVDTDKNTWSTMISQSENRKEGTPRDFKIALYVTSESGHYAITKYLERCAVNHSYEKVLVDFPGTVRVKHVEDLRVELKH